MGVKNSYDQIKKFVSENSTSELLSTEYVGTFDKLLFRCKCGNVFQASWHQFYTQNRRDCIECSTERRIQKRRNNFEDVKSFLRTKGLEYVSGEYKGERSKFTVRCKCGHLRTSSLNLMRADSFSCECLACTDKRTHGSNRFTLEKVKALCEERGLNLLSTEYKNARTPLLFRCNCGREFSTTWERVHQNNKIRCDYCTHKVSSGEKKIEDWLLDKGISYKMQYGFDDLRGATGRKYKFDFYLPDYNLCIEYDGQQHKKAINFSGKEDETGLIMALWENYLRDSEKDKYCFEKGIGLLRIGYENFDRIEEILDSKLIPR